MTTITTATGTYLNLGGQNIAFKTNNQHDAVLILAGTELSYSIKQWIANNERAIKYVSFI